MRRRVWAGILLVVGCLQMAGDLLGSPPLKALGAATAASPAPKVFSAVEGLETYSTHFFLVWRDAAGREREVELTAEICARLRGPYNRRNVYGAALAYGPVLASSEEGRALLGPVLEHGLGGERPLLEELGVGPEEDTPVWLRYRPIPGTNMGELPREIGVP